MSGLLLKFGCYQLIFGLFLAWIMVLTAHVKLSFLQKIIKSYRDLVKAHLDYFLMSLFLFSFFCLSRTLEFEPNFGATVLILYGTSVNPLGFLIPALNPKVDSYSMTSFYKLLIGSAFLATTSGICWFIFQALSRASSFSSV